MRGSIVKRQGKATKDGKPITLYYIVYQVGKRQKWEAVPERTRKAAEKLLTKRLNEIGNGEYIEPSDMTFGEFKEMWVEKYARGQVRPSTLSSYAYLFRGHLIPAFGEMELARIGVEDVQGFRAQMSAKGLSPQTVKLALRLLRQMLSHAVDWGYIRQNAAKKVRDPRVPKGEMDCLTPGEIRVFLDSVPGKWYAIFLTAITTGLRIGELMAMKWGNMDWNQGRYFVKETLRRTGDFGEPKTEGSLAPVDLTPACLEALKAHRARQSEEKLKAGGDWRDLDLIFTASEGRPLNWANFETAVFGPALKKAELRHIRFHDLRHTCASLLINQGASPKYIQKQLRHGSIEMTFDRYGHLFPDASREAVRRLDETIFGSGNKAMAGKAI